MTYLRLPEAEGGGDPGAVARSVFRQQGWWERYPSLPIAGTWQGLHYLITGDPWDGPHPAADVVCGGRLLTENGAEELGVQGADDWIDKPTEAVRDRDLRTAYERLAGFFKAAADEGQAIYKAMG